MNKKTAVITGASRGIGRAAALKFAGAGYDISVCCLKNGIMLESLSREIYERFGRQCLIFTGDIGDYETAEHFTDSTLKAFGHIDVLINNAGRSCYGLLTDMTPQQWQDIINVNLTSVFNCCRLAVPSMIRRQSGRIINISSVWGECGASCEVAYSASKGGVNAFTRALAKELAPSHIQVNAISCGIIDTDMNSFLTGQDIKALTDEIPAGRMGSPEEVADLALSVAESPAYLTGQIITIDGAWI